MKLVEILAEEMEAWPEGISHLTQSSVDREIYDARDGKEEDSVDSLNPRFDTRRSHSEEKNYPIVTRAQWQAERGGQKGGEWKRHRGGKQPVADEVRVEFKFRSGVTGECLADDLLWDHQKQDDDVMQYRVISQPQAEDPDMRLFNHEISMDSQQGEIIHGPIKMGDTVIAPAHAKWHEDQIDGPIKWRDTIIHCQAIIEDCEREIQRNVDLLDAEGLMMQTDSKKAMQHYAPDVDMSDWRNWEIGDHLKIFAEEEGHEFEIGQTVKVIGFTRDDESLPVKAESLDGDEYWFVNDREARFIKRP